MATNVEKTKAFMELVQRKNCIRNANLLSNPLERYPAYQTYQFPVDEGSFIELDIAYRWKSQLTAPFFIWAYDLTEQSLRELYRKCGIRWNKTVTYGDMVRGWARYLIALDPFLYEAVGFTMFRFEIDDDQPVLNCFWIILEENFRGRGLGKHLVKAMEQIAHDTGMELVLMAVLRKDTNVLNFLIDLGYLLDKRSLLPPTNGLFVTVSKAIKRTTND